MLIMMQNELIDLISGRVKKTLLDELKHASFFFQ